MSRSAKLPPKQFVPKAGMNKMQGVNYKVNFSTKKWQLKVTTTNNRRHLCEIAITHTLLLKISVRFEAMNA
jgi:hypothetical protein